jgi:adenylate cyclase
VFTRLRRAISFGTERYPEKEARRLRAVNIAAFCAAVVPLTFGLHRAATDPEGWMFGLGTTLIGIAILATPLLHRFNSVAAPFALGLLIYAHIFRVVYTSGTSDGAYMTYLTAAGVGVLLVGLDHMRLAAVMAALAAALMILLHTIVPAQTGLLAQQVPGRSGNFAVNAIGNAVILFAIVLYSVRQTARAEAAVEREYARSEALLGNILPPRVAARLKDEKVIADRYEAASVLFADMAGFTARASDTEPEALVGFLDGVFTRIDALVEAHGLEKIKTTGDAYMVVAGVPEPRPDHAEALADLALAIREAVADLKDPKGRAVPVRIGIASGPVVAGVVGRRKFFYDVWGDTVNVAARMEQTGEPGHIQISSGTRKHLVGRFTLKARGGIEIRGKGSMRTWFLVARKSAKRRSV